jgi:hypothetical protein
MSIATTGFAIGSEPQKHVQMIVHRREPADAHREDFAQLFQPIFDPLFTAGRPFDFAEQERLSNAARRAVIPAGHRRIDLLPASDGH